MRVAGIFSDDIMIVGILLAIGIAFFILIITRALVLNIRRYFRGRVEKSILNLIIKIVNYTVFVLAALAILPMLGINLSGLIVAGGILGLVVGFASQKIVSNLMSGIFLMVEQPIKTGQHIQIEGTAGVVEDLNVFATMIRTSEGLSVRVPNEKVFTTILTNSDDNVARLISCEILLGNRDDAEKAIGIIGKLIDEHSFTLKNPGPLVFAGGISEKGVAISVQIWVPTQVWGEIRRELVMYFRDSLESGGIVVREITI